MKIYLTLLKSYLMKKILTSMIVMLGFTLGAQSILKTSPIALAFGAFNLCYEKPISTKGSFEVSGGYIYKIFGVDVSTISVGAGYRAYLTKKEAPAGFYIMPNVGANFGSAGDSKFKVFDGGALIGYQIVAGSGFVFDVGAGPSYNILSGDYDNAGFDTTGGIVPTVRLAIGFAFGGDKK
jgi:hypothetical protein